MGIASVQDINCGQAARVDDAVATLDLLLTDPPATSLRSVLQSSLTCSMVDVIRHELRNEIMKETLTAVPAAPTADVYDGEGYVNHQSPCFLFSSHARASSVVRAGHVALPICLTIF